MNNKYNDYFSKVIYSHHEIMQAIDVLADKINSYYKSLLNEEIVVLTILDSSIVFVGQLLLKLDFNIFCKTVTPFFKRKKNLANVSDVWFEFNFDTAFLKTKKILVLDTICETGLTLSSLKSYILKTFSPQEVKICTLFKKEIKNQKKNIIDWCGLVLGNEKVVGFGLDSRGKYRNFEHLGVLKIEKR